MWHFDNVAVGAGDTVHELFERRDDALCCLRDRREVCERLEAYAGKHVLAHFVCGNVCCAKESEHLQQRAVFLNAMREEICPCYCKISTLRVVWLALTGNVSDPEVFVFAVVVNVDDLLDCVRRRFGFERICDENAVFCAVKNPANKTHERVQRGGNLSTCCVEERAESTP